MPPHYTAAFTHTPHCTAFPATRTPTTPHTATPSHTTHHTHHLPRRRKSDYSALRGDSGTGTTLYTACYHTPWSFVPTTYHFTLHLYLPGSHTSWTMCLTHACYLCCSHTLHAMWRYLTFMAVPSLTQPSCLQVGRGVPAGVGGGRQGLFCLPQRLLRTHLRTATGVGRRTAAWVDGYSCHGRYPTGSGVKRRAGGISL